MIVSTPIAKSLLRSIYEGPAFRGIWQMVRLAPHPELAEGEGRGEILSTICLLNYGLVSKIEA